MKITVQTEHMKEPDYFEHSTKAGDVAIIIIKQLPLTEKPHDFVGGAFILEENPTLEDIQTIVCYNVAKLIMQTEGKTEA